ncbi:hypothetical protein ACFV97_05970 [Streptomyces sp. NPDC059913]|uniref:hypothetical protein n=1 Tax=unclassified Streptomyces TaxID=2593676 RepID=UPI003663B181
MHSDTHLLLHHLRTAESHCHNPEFTLPAPAPRPGLRTRLGWALVELGLRVLPRQAARPFTAHSPA